MNNTFTVIAREFTTRVRKKSFLLITIFVPLLIVVFYAFLMWLMFRDDTNERQIVVVNNSTLVNPIDTIGNNIFTYTEDTITEKNAAEYLKNHTEYYAVMWLPENIMNNADVPVYSTSQVPMDLKHSIAEQLKTRIETIKKDSLFESLNIPDIESKLDATKAKVNVRTLIVEETGEVKEGSAEITSVIGMVACIIIFFFVLMYATQVMKGVIEEKENRIIEVLVSSVKPFQFLLGKIIGIAAVGLLQFTIWIVLIMIAVVGIQFVAMPNIDMEALRSTATDLTAMAQVSNIDVDNLKVVQKISQILNPNFVMSFIGVFLFYFLGSYLLYASLFAAIGSAVDNETDSQQFMTPLSIILMVGFYIGFGAMKNPESSLAVWSSIIPFTSPMVMLVRFPFGVPAWELISSMLLLVAAFIFFTWLSARIYRVGILMYGKKTTWKELLKWITYK
ncbi:MAG: ABC transporter permease [Culturomica sp.]|jgi:ABC-2 type transport system permease protein|nr:ABC transporter permease [Culturomica sp.]